MASSIYRGIYADIDLNSNKVGRFELGEGTMRKYIGGIGIGAKILYDRVKRSVTSWEDPDNCVIIAGGPLSGTNVAGSGAFCAVTKGALTNGATSAQANGYFGNYLKKAGLDGFVIQGRSDNWVYLYISEAGVSILDASFLLGLDTWETESKLKEIHGEGSVFSIGPAGESRVRFSALVGDEGHVAAHNGIGAVLGSKKVKAFMADKGSAANLDFSDKSKLSGLAKEMIQKALKTENVQKGTSHLLGKYLNTGLLPIRNLTTSVVNDEFDRLKGEYYREKFDLKKNTCWACPSGHCHMVTVTEGPYKGYVGEEPEYELFAGWGSNIGNTDPGAVVMLNDVCDRLGMDGNEASWLTAFLMECYETGIVNASDLDGIELNFGNVEGVRLLLNKIAKREGIGELLSRGIKETAEQLGSEAEKIAVYVHKGHAPRGHDHRARWFEMFDTATSNVGTIESTRSAMDDDFSPAELVRALYEGKTRNFVDSLVVCCFTSMTMGSNDVSHLVAMVRAVTGWNYTTEEAFEMSLRTVNLLRTFNYMHNLTAESEKPSARYGSVPKDGPVKGKDVLAVWDEVLDKYYTLMGWDRKSGKPLPETLDRLGLSFACSDLWG